MSCYPVAAHLRKAAEAELEDLQEMEQNGVGCGVGWWGS
jgi:hypothetical protein